MQSIARSKIEQLMYTQVILTRVLNTPSLDTYLFQYRVYSSFVNSNVFVSLL